MSAFGSPRAGCAFRLLGFALILSGSGCAVIVLQKQIDLQNLIYLAVAAMMLGGGFLFIWDTQRTQDAANERRSGEFVSISANDANTLMSQGKRIVDRMPDYDGNLEGLRSSGWVDFPGSVIVTYERTLKQKYGTVPVCISIGFSADGTQYGPYYHLEPYYPHPGDY